MKKERKQIVVKTEELSINTIIAEEQASCFFLKSENLRLKILLEADQGQPTSVTGDSWTDWVLLSLHCSFAAVFTLRSIFHYALYYNCIVAAFRGAWQGLSLVCGLRRTRAGTHLARRRSASPPAGLATLHLLHFTQNIIPSSHPQGQVGGCLLWCAARPGGWLLVCSLLQCTSLS